MLDALFSRDVIAIVLTSWLLIAALGCFAVVLRERVRSSSRLP